MAQLTNSHQILFVALIFACFFNAVTNSLNIPQEGSFKISMNDQAIHNFKNKHDNHWMGMYQLSTHKLFASSLESPLALFYEKSALELKVGLQGTFDKCISVKYGQMTPATVGFYYSGIYGTVSKVLQHYVEHALQSEKWVMVERDDISRLAKCSHNDKVFINLLSKESDDAFIGCVRPFEDYPYRMISKMATIELENRITETMSELYSNLHSECESETSPKQEMKRQVKQVLISPKQPWFVRVLQLSETSIIRKQQGNGTKTCVFLHGAGETLDAPPVNSFPHYWGDITYYTTQCKETWFVRKDTKYKGWTSEELQTSFCDLARINNPNSTLIKDTIVFTHSMANLIFPAAMYKGYCKLDLSTSSWVSVSAPFNGSKAAIYLKSMCYQYVHRTAPNPLQHIIDFIAVVTQNCDGDGPIEADATLLPGFCDSPNVTYHGLKPLCLGSPIYDYAKPMISARLCGYSPMGLMSYFGVALELFAELVQYGEDNDGLVPVSSCLMGTSLADFEGDPQSNNYYAQINHADATCRDGNAMFNDLTKQPCSYYGFRK